MRHYETTSHARVGAPNIRRYVPGMQHSPTTTIDQILRCLNEQKMRATYGAVGDLLGVSAPSAGRKLGDRRPLASWVVRANTGLPSWYCPDQIHPHLCAHRHIIVDSGELQELLADFEPDDDTRSDDAPQLQEFKDACAEMVGLIREVVYDPIGDSTTDYELRFAVTRFIRALDAARKDEDERWLLESHFPEVIRTVWPS